MKIDNFNLNNTEKETLLSYAKSGEFPQTILVEGSSANVRTDFARFIANLILCQSDSDKPCGRCQACIKCEALSNPDIREFGEEKTGAVFKVETAREIRSDAFVIPNDSDRKVYIVKETQNMNEAAQNAMLKILEEPPYFDFFILTAESRGAMLDTILSRAVVISLGEKEFSFSDEARDICKKLSRALASRSRTAVLEALAALSADKGIFEEFCGCFEALLTESLKNKRLTNPAHSFDGSRTLGESFTDKELFDLFNAAGEFRKQFKQNANYNLLITYMSVRLYEAIG